MADYGNRAIRKITPAGVVSTVLGRFDLMGFTDGSAAPGVLGSPRNVAVVGKSLFITDYNGVAMTSSLP